ncbi:MAG TPA: tripartite tricarboxylate transporter substrate binding protein [Roseomonas sp.]|jgi:tripartite-type tricarboxylate transporter receptor subunit TctC
MTIPAVTRRALGVLGLGLAAPALAQQPARIIRFVVPWAPGGLNDLIARAFNDRVSRVLGQTIVNDFKPGAGGRIGVAEVARAAPDGLTIGMGNLGPLTIFPNLYRDMPFDVARDLAPIMMFAASPLVLVVEKDFPARTLADLVAMAKARPGRMNYASIGIGSAQHLIFEMLRGQDGVEMEHVPYRGSGDSIIALLQNDVQAMFDTLPSMLPLLRDGRYRALAVTTPDRVPQLPDVPTLKETGLDIDVATWYAVIAPARTPEPVLASLYDAYTRVSLQPEMQGFLAEQGLIYLPNTRAEFAARIAAETARWGQIIRDRRISVT